MSAPLLPGDNLILGSLPPVEQTRLFPSLEWVTLKAGAVVYEAYERGSYVYFPVDCILATLYEIEDGDAAESAVVGSEGFAGAALLLGGQSTPTRVVVKNPGGAYRVKREVIKAEFDRQGALCDLCLRYIQFLLTEISQTAICNRHHSLEQQLCRSLLISIDRLRGTHLSVTQQVIADTLGVTRPSVTQVAGRLRRLGLIEYRRGAIDVLDRAGLEQLCCECYGILKAESDRLLSSLSAAARTG